MPLIDEFRRRLEVEGKRADAEFQFAVAPLEGPMDVLQIDVLEHDTPPLFLSVSGVQLMVIAHLFRDEDVEPEKRTNMLEKMLELSLPMPLSSYGKMGDLYVVFGAMAVDSSTDEILLELENLADNALEGRKLMMDYLL